MKSRSLLTALLMGIVPLGYPALGAGTRAKAVAEQRHEVISVLGGFLTENVSWRAIFYINIPVAIGAVAATLFAVRESRDTSVGRDVDYPGIAALTIGLTALVLALVEGNEWDGLGREWRS